MNQLAKWMMRLYPARWRKRYGDELDALLADTGADARIVADLAKGGIRMQFSTWSFLKLALVLGIAGMLAGLGFTLFTPTSYVATTELHLTGTDSAVPAFERLQSELTTRWRVSTVINDPALQLYPNERRTEPLDDVIEQMRRNVSIALNDASKISIRFVYPDRQKAELAVRVLSANAVQIVNAMPVPEKLYEHPELDVIETANLPAHPLRPDAGIVAMAGMAIALLVALPFRRARRKILMFVFAGAAAGMAVAWIIPSLPSGARLDMLPLRYESHMTLYGYSADPAVASDIVAQLSSRTVMAAIIAEPRLMLYRDQQKTRDLSEIADTMRRDMRVTTRKSSFAQVFGISFVYSDRFRVQQAVEAMATRLIVAYEKEARPVDPHTRMNWGTLTVAANPGITMAAITPDRERPMLFGLTVGLSLAAIVALVRRRWTLENHEPAVLAPIRPSRFAGARFRKLAFRFTAAGIVIGSAVAIATPKRYVSEASFILHNADRWSAATLTEGTIERALPKIARARNLDPLEAHRALKWHEDASIDKRFQRFDIRYVSDQPRVAWSVLEDILGAVDRSVSSLKMPEEGPYETIRGVDGALLPIPTEHYSQLEVFHSLAVNPGYTTSGSLLVNRSGRRVVEV